MTPTEFVIELKRAAHSGADSTMRYLAAPEGRKPSEPLASLSGWYRGLSESDKEMARTLARYSADGSLFHLLSVLDGVINLGPERGSFEIYYVSGDGKTRLNDPEGDFLYDIFNAAA